MTLIRPFQPADQVEARLLILSGLVEHWGWLDETKNPDLDDIALTFAAGVFLVAWREGRLVGTGGLLPASDPQTWQIVRMSVASGMRRLGLGRQILAALESEARQRGARRLILETTATWQDVIAFYLRCGFRTLGAAPSNLVPQDEGGDVYFEKWL